MNLDIPCRTCNELGAVNRDATVAMQRLATEKERLLESLQTATLRKDGPAIAAANDALAAHEAATVEAKAEVWV